MESNIVPRQAGVWERGQGFDAKLQDLDRHWSSAERAHTEEAWAAAMDHYATILAFCRSLQELNTARADARHARTQAEAAREIAAKANAAQDASKLFEDAARAISQAAEAYSGGDFSHALTQWENAASTYDAAAERAKAMQSYKEAGARYEAVLMEATSSNSVSAAVQFLNRFGGPKWKALQRQVRTAETSTNAPLEGREAYESAIANLAAAVSEAEEKAGPILEIIALYQGNEISVQLSDGTHTWETPTTVLLKKGGHYRFTLSRLPGNFDSRWEPAAFEITADWLGQKSRQVVLQDAETQLSQDAYILSKELKAKAYRQHATATIEIGQSALRSARYQRARAYFDNAIETLKRLGNRPEDEGLLREAKDGLAETFYRWAIVFKSQGDREAALQRALQAKTAGHPKGQELVTAIQKQQARW